MMKAYFLTSMIVVAILLAPVASSAAPARGQNEEFIRSREIEEVLKRVHLIDRNPKATALERFSIFDEYLTLVQKYGHPIENIDRIALEGLREAAAREGFAGDIDAFMREVVGEGKDNTKGPVVTLEDYNKTIKRKEDEFNKKIKERDVLNVPIKTDNLSSSTPPQTVCFDVTAQRVTANDADIYTKLNAGYLTLRSGLSPEYTKVCVEMKNALKAIGDAEYQIRKIEKNRAGLNANYNTPDNPSNDPSSPQMIASENENIAVHRKNIESSKARIQHWEGELKKLTEKIGFLNFEIMALERDMKELREQRAALFGSGATPKKKVAVTSKDCAGNLEKLHIADLKKTAAKRDTALKKAKSLDTATARLDAKKKAQAAYTANMKIAAKQLATAKALCKKSSAVKALQH